MSEDPTVTLTLSLTAVNVALTALGEMPAKQSMAVIRDIQAQTLKQLQPVAAEPAAPAEGQ